MYSNKILILILLLKIVREANQHLLLYSLKMQMLNSKQLKSTNERLCKKNIKNRLSSDKVVMF